MLRSGGRCCVKKRGLRRAFWWQRCNGRQLAGKGREFLDQIRACPKLQFLKQPDHRRPVILSQHTISQAQFDRHVTDNRRQAFAEQGGIALTVKEFFVALGHQIKLLKQRLNRAKLVEQRQGTLFANALDAGNVVTGIALEAA